MIATLRLPDTDKLLDRASTGGRLSVDEAVLLAEHAPLADLGMAADMLRQRLNPGKRVSYIVERNINYTNVCNVYCRFCAFYRAPGRPGGYTLSKDELASKIDETVAAGGYQILLQGGLNPECDIFYYEDLFRWMKERWPSVNLHALSADEVLHVAKVSSLTVEQSLARLIAAGMGSLPGAGAEILVDHVRKRIARLKSPGAVWIDVHRTAHRLGIPSTCTMMFGVEETWHDRVTHLDMLRSLQDEMHGFTAFITWPYQQGDLRLKAGNTSADEYLRVQAVSRLFLDNIPHLQSSWVTQGPSIGQIALNFGADDFGAVMFEENVVSAAGTTYRMNSAWIEDHIRRAGFTPWRRNVRYQAVSA
jgi:cyclic dehypoxanthinyl futalosine synthase